MGRWAQRQRGGGGGQNPPVKFQITDSINEGGHLIDFTYGVAYPIGSVVPAAFQSFPSGAIGVSVVDLGSGSNYFELTMSLNTTSDTTMKYTGHAPGVLSPQEVGI